MTARLEHPRQPTHAVALRPRLGIFEGSRGPSGPARYVESIISAIDPNEFDVHLFGFADSPLLGQSDFPTHIVGPRRSSTLLPRQASATSENATATVSRKQRTWRRLAPQSLRALAGFGRECWRLAHCFREAPVDLLHTNDTGLEESGPAARLAGVGRILGTFHVDPSVAGWDRRLAERVCNRSLHRAIAVSESTRQSWIRRSRLPADHVVTIQNGVDPGRFRKVMTSDDARRQLELPEGRLLIGGVGRLMEVKGFRYLIDALALLASEFPAASIVLAGAGPLQSELSSLAAAHGLGDRVHFLGHCPDPRVVYNALDIFAFPSLSEAIGYALLEAMACELPAVGSDVGGIPEVIVPGETGFLVPPKDPLALAGRLRPLLADASLRRRMGQAGRERISNRFHEKDTVTKTIDVYREMLRLSKPQEEKP